MIVKFVWRCGDETCGVSFEMPHNRVIFSDNTISFLHDDELLDELSRVRLTVFDITEITVNGRFFNVSYYKTVSVDGGDGLRVTTFSSWTEKLIVLFEEESQT